MKKEVDLLKKKIEKAKVKRKELLSELNVLKKFESEQRQSKDLKKIEKLKKQLLNNI